METLMKTVQRFLYIGNDAPFFIDGPHTPLDEEVGKNVLRPIVKLDGQESPNGTEVPKVVESKRKEKQKLKKASIIDGVRKRTSQLLAGKRTEKQKDKKVKQNATVVEGEEKKDSVPAMSEALQRYHTMRQFRSAPTISKVLDYIKQHGMTLDMLPPHFLRSGKVWEALYPTITYHELLWAALRLQDFRLLNPDSTHVETYVAALQNRLTDLELEQIHPVALHRIAMLYENHSRYESKKKELFHHALDCPVNAKVLAKLWSAVEHSFSHHPKTGVRYYIALDLREAHAKKNVFRNSIISCFHASVMLAFSIYKREKDVTVMAFTEEAGVLKPVEFEESMTWLDAVAHCQALLLPKTKVSLVAPIARAEADKVKVDLFITITDSLIRVNPLRTPPYEALQDYRKKVKLSLSRYAAISLSNHVPSFDFTSCQDATGILEMVGYNDNTPKIIEAFAKNLFM